MRAPMPNPLPLEVMRSSSVRTDRISDTDELKEAIKAEQELSQFIYLCSKRLETEVSIDFHGDDPHTGPRYRICVVDATAAAATTANNKPISTFAMFIVPIGRDAEWLFASPKGRRALQTQCGRDRLAIVFLNRQQKYDDGMEGVKRDIAHFVGMLDCRKDETIGNFEILSVGGTDVKRTVASGRSEVNGNWSVEELQVDGVYYRRLVFLNTMNLIQSEAYLKKKKNKQVIDLDTLACDFHRMMIGSLAMSPCEPLARIDAQCRMAVLGLGGGLLTAFLVRNFRKARVTAVELDPEVQKIANSHFSFPHSDARIEVVIQDALVFLEETARKEDDAKFDVIFCDVSGSQNAALQCPPPAFLTDAALDNMKNALRANGMLSLNLVTRDADISANIKASIAKHFPHLYAVYSEEDVNEVIIGMKTPRESAGKALQPEKLVNTVRRDLGSYEDVCAKIRHLRTL